MDDRVKQHAKILVDYSLKVKPDDNVLIRYEDHGLELAEAISELCSRRGAIPMIYQVPATFLRSMYELTPAQNLSKMPRCLFSAVIAADALVQIRGEEDLTSLKDVNKEKIKIRSLAAKPISDEQMRKRWVLTQTPCSSYAKEAGMSLEEYKDFVYGAVLRDWRAERKKLKKVERLMDKTDEVRIVGKDTDMTLSIKGRKAVSDDGKKNMPGGEVFSGPVEDSANGHIHFDIPIISLGNEIRDVRLEFKKGKVVGYKAAVGQDFLESQVKTDEGSARLGEFAIGMNNSISRFTKNILFDEKMGGTIHEALGRGYPDCRSKNNSAIHLDMIRTMDDSELFFDDKRVMDGRELLIPQ